MSMFQSDCGDFENLPWFTAVETFCHGHGHEELEHTDRQTLSNVIEKTVLPKITGNAPSHLFKKLISNTVYSSWSFSTIESKLAYGCSEGCVMFEQSLYTLSLTSSSVCFSSQMCWHKHHLFLSVALFAQPTWSWCGIPCPAVSRSACRVFVTDWGRTTPSSKESRVNRSRWSEHWHIIGNTEILLLCSFCHLKKKNSDGRLFLFPLQSNWLFEINAIARGRSLGLASDWALKEWNL